MKKSVRRTVSSALALAMLASLPTAALATEYTSSQVTSSVSKIVTTGQTTTTDNNGDPIITYIGSDFYGQDGNYEQLDFNFIRYDNGTTYDVNTGLTWETIPNGGKNIYSEAVAYVESLNTMVNEDGSIGFGGYTDWRMPTITEMLSISDFGQVDEGGVYLDTEYFEFLEDESVGRIADTAPQDGPAADVPTYENSEVIWEADPDNVSKDGGQFWTAEVSPYLNSGEEMAWGVNQVTGHIKTYAMDDGILMGKYVRAVRGDEYGANDFVDNGNGTISDNGTGLMWMQEDLGYTMTWEEALAAAESYEFAGYDDWRLPTVKELQTLAEYDTTAIPVIAGGLLEDGGLFDLTYHEENSNWWYWTSTSASPANAAWYVAFGYTSHGYGACLATAKSSDNLDGQEGSANYYNSVLLVRVDNTEEEATTILSNQVTEAISKVVTTGQTATTNNNGDEITTYEGSDFYGQDGNYEALDFNLVRNDDGTTSDLNTGLMWETTPNSGKNDYEGAVAYVESLNTMVNEDGTIGFAGYTDWRMPTITELFSISDFDQGNTYLDTTYFDFLEDTETGRIADTTPQDGGSPPDMSEIIYEADPDEVSKDGGQFWTAYESPFNDTAWGVNHVTGHIKTYAAMGGGVMGKYVRAVRGDEYGVNDFVDNGDGTITDNGTDLMWMQTDLGYTMTWEEALAAAESYEYAGYDDWRLPDIKELQTLANYTTTEIPVIAGDGIFELTYHEENADYWYWSSTSAVPANAAWYIAFGYTTHGYGAGLATAKSEDNTDGQEGGANFYNSVILVRTPTEEDALVEEVPTPEVEVTPEVAPETTGGTYTVVSGDSLWSIAAAIYGSGTYYTDIYALNADILTSATLIYPGQVIQLP